MLKRWPKSGFPCAYYGKYFLALNFSVNAYLLFQWKTYPKFYKFKIIKPLNMPGVTRAYLGRLEIEIKRKVNGR